MEVNVSFQVKKRDKSLEKYDPEKIKKVVMAAGLTEKQALFLCGKINEWAMGLKRKIVTSIEIKDQVVKEILKLDHYAAQKYIWYEKYKDRMDEIKN